ncbi:MAG TPA: LmeA family phospholipid-binding protein [Fimbriimonadaceae bacterium]|nr:LmeA family phospholipid-binding protein [Fimbriimonadaceae bacterium]
MALRAGEVELPMGLSVDEITVESDGAGVETDPFSVSFDKPAKARVLVTAASVAKFLNETRPGGLADFAVETSEGLLVVGATAVVLIPIRAVAHCSLSIREGTFLDVVLKRIDPGAAAGIVEKQLAAINPILDTSGLPFKIEMQSVEIADGNIVVEGTASN